MSITFCTEGGLCLELPKFNLKNISNTDELHKEFISWVKFFYIKNYERMLNLFSIAFTEGTQSERIIFL